MGDLLAKAKLVMWWAEYHLLNLMLAAEPSSIGREHLIQVMMRHDLKHPTGEAPKW